MAVRCSKVCLITFMAVDHVGYGSKLGTVPQWYELMIYKWLVYGKQWPGFLYFKPYLWLIMLAQSTCCHTLSQRRVWLLATLVHVSVCNLSVFSAKHFKCSPTVALIYNHSFPVFLFMVSKDPPQPSPGSSLFPITQNWFLRSRKPWAVAFGHGWVSCCLLRQGPKAPEYLSRFLHIGILRSSLWACKWPSIPGSVRILPGRSMLFLEKIWKISWVLNLSALSEVLNLKTSCPSWVQPTWVT